MEDPDDDKMVTRLTMFRWMSLNPYVSLVDYSDTALLLSRKERWGRHLILEEQLLLLLLVIVCIR